MEEGEKNIKKREKPLPPYLMQLEAEIKRIGEQKKRAADAQNYEEAAVLRDSQSALVKELTEKQAAWQKEQCSVVDADDIAAVVAGWTKIPGTMPTGDESKQIQNLEASLHSRGVGQD